MDGHALLALADENAYVLAAHMVAEEQVGMYLGQTEYGRAYLVCCGLACATCLLRPTVTATEALEGEPCVAGHQHRRLQCSDMILAWQSRPMAGANLNY